MDAPARRERCVLPLMRDFRDAYRLGDFSDTNFWTERMTGMLAAMRPMFCSRLETISGVLDLGGCFVTYTDQISSVVDVSGPKSLELVNRNVVSSTWL